VLLLGAGGVARSVAKSGWPLAQKLPEVFVTDSMGPIGSGCIGLDIETPGFTTPEAIRAGRGATCVFGDCSSAAPDFVLIGDSYAFMWARALDGEAKKYQQHGIGLTWSGCVPLVDFARAGTRAHCAAYIAAALDCVVNSPIPQVILAGYWPTPDNSAHWFLGDAAQAERSSLYVGLERALARLAQTDKQVYVLRGIPEQPSRQALQRAWLKGQNNPGRPVYGPTLAQHRLRQQKHDADIDALQEKYHGAVLDQSLDLAPMT